MQGGRERVCVVQDGNMCGAMLRHILTVLHIFSYTIYLGLYNNIAKVLSLTRRKFNTHRGGNF